MTKAKATALLEAFLAAKAAGQEELWRASHPEAPDGPTVLILLLLANRKLVAKGALEQALETVDNRCGLRIAIYAAIAAHPVWVNGFHSYFQEILATPGAAIRAAIAWYRDPTEGNRRASHMAWKAALYAARAAGSAGAAAASEAADCAASAAFIAANAADHVTAAAVGAQAVHQSAGAVNSGKVISAMIAAIVDHYEGRPLVIP